MCTIDYKPPLGQALWLKWMCAIVYKHPLGQAYWLKWMCAIDYKPPLGQAFWLKWICAIDYKPQPSRCPTGRTFDVDGQSIGPGALVKVDDDSAVLTAHSGLTDGRVIPPVRPVDHPESTRRRWTNTGSDSPNGRHSQGGTVNLVSKASKWVMYILLFHWPIN